MKFVQQYINLQLCITENAGLLPTYRPYIQEWKPNKRFYVGDCVHYVMDSTLDPYGNVYRLTGQGGNLKTEWIDVPFRIYSVFGGRRRLEDGRYQIYVKYYKGYFDEKSKLTKYF